MTTPGDADEFCWGLAHLARQTEGVVEFKVRSDRAGITLLHWSSTLVLFLNCNIMCLSARAFGPTHYLKYTLFYETVTIV